MMHFVVYCHITNSMKVTRTHLKGKPTVKPDFADVSSIYFRLNSVQCTRHKKGSMSKHSILCKKYNVPTYHSLI